MDVGDTIAITFTTTPGATVTATWSREDGTTVLDRALIAESPVGSGQYPAAFTGDTAGLWQALFRATGTTAAVEPYFVRFRALEGPLPLATVDEYAELFGPLSAARASLARALLRSASQLVRDAHPTVDERIDNGRLSVGTVALAVLQMTARVLRNPNGLRSESTGPFTRAYDPDLASGMLALTEAEEAMLAGERPARRRAGTIWTRPGLGASRVPR